MWVYAGINATAAHQGYCIHKWFSALYAHYHGQYPRVTQLTSHAMSVRQPLVAMTSSLHRALYSAVKAAWNTCIVQHMHEHTCKLLSTRQGTHAPYLTSTGRLYQA